MSGIHKIYRRDNQPYAQIPNAAIRDPEISPNGFRLLAYLMSHSDGYDLTYGQIERETGLGRFAINGAISVLSRKGWLEVKTTKLPNGQFGPKAWFVKDPTTSATVGNSTAGDSTVEQPTDNKKNTIREEQIENSYPQASLEGFSEFWEIYPRKVEKLAAQRAFKKALEIVDSQTIIDGARRYATDANLPEKQYIPHPSTWLNSGRWEDEPLPERVLSPDQIKKREEEDRMKRREFERQRILEEQASRRREEEELKAKAQNVTRCEHDRVAAICPKCNLLSIRDKRHD